jgi:hypothetical protein
MRKLFADKIEGGRFVHGPFGSRRGDPYGAFDVQGPSGRRLKIIASDGIDPDASLAGWEHVSVSIAGKFPPNWQEMSWVKDHFWRDDETVIQFHPARAHYVNLHPNCLHLWKRVDHDYELPPRGLI